MPLKRPNSVPTGTELSRSASATTMRATAGAPTPGVRRENDRARDYAEELERAIIAFGRPGELGLQKVESPQAGGHMVGAEDLDTEELFQRKAADVSRMLEGVARNVRLEHLNEDNREARMKAERDEERRQREHDERKARQRERQARDPHRKVALKLENGRRFGRTNSGVAHTVPMKEVEVGSTKGQTSEKVGMVDVEGLRARCQRLNNGSVTTVELLLQDQRRRESEEKRGHTLKGSASAPMFSSMGELRVSLRQRQRENSHL